MSDLGPVLQISLGNGVHFECKHNQRMLISDINAEYEDNMFLFGILHACLDQNLLEHGTVSPSTDQVLHAIVYTAKY